MYTLIKIFYLQKWDTIHSLVHLCVNRFFWLMTRNILWCGFIQTSSREGHSYSLCFQSPVTTKKAVLNIFVHTLTGAYFNGINKLLGEVKL